MEPWMIVADDGERQISLPDVKQRMHIVGRDLEDIDAEFITGESELYVEYAPNLKSIVLGREKKSWQSDSKKSGCKITFTEIPRNTVSIDGRIEEIVLPRETEPLTIGRVRDHYTLALEDSWGAMISSEQNITNDCNENDLLIFIAKGDENKIVEIDGEWNHIVVIGDSDFASNKYITSSRNQDLFANSVNWLTKDTELISLRVKETVFRELVLTKNERAFIRWSGWLLMPSIIGSLGILAWWRRR